MRVWRIFSLLMAAGCLVSAPTQAEPIGAAVAVERDVTHADAGAVAKLDEGDRLNQNELITTQTASSAKIQFLDQTLLMVGPASRVKLDRFVYNPDRTAADFSLELLRGGFRFVTGKSDYKTYKIKTPDATIGVRGTIIGIFVEKGKTTVKLKEGGMTVCPRGKGAKCQDVEDIDDIVVVRAGRVSAPTPRKGMQPEFPLWCSAGKATCGLPPPAAPAPK